MNSYNNRGEFQKRREEKFERNFKEKRVKEKVIYW